MSSSQELVVLFVEIPMYVEVLVSVLQQIFAVTIIRKLRHFVVL